MLYPGIINQVIKATNKIQADVLLGNYIRISEHESPHFKPVDTLTISKNPHLKTLPRDPEGAIMNAVWAGIFRRSFLLAKAITFNEKMIAQEDTLFYYVIGLRTKQIYRFDEPSYIYRQRGSSVMHSRNANRALGYYHSMQELYRVYKEHYDTNDYDDEYVIQQKLLHMRQNLILTLAGVYDTKIVWRELKKAKKNHLYPYSHNFLSPVGYRRILIFLLPREWGFWIIHFLYKIRTIFSSK